MSDKHLKTKKLTNVDVSEFLLSNNIRDQTKLMAIAKDRHSAGEKDLYRFIISRSSKSLSELIDMTWKINNASSELEREQQSRISILKKYLEQECAAGCNGQWLVCVPNKHCSKMGLISIILLRPCVSYWKKDGHC